MTYAVELIPKREHFGSLENPNKATSIAQSETAGLRYDRMLEVLLDYKTGEFEASTNANISVARWFADTFLEGNLE